MRTMGIPKEIGPLTSKRGEAVVSREHEQVPTRQHYLFKGDGFGLQCLESMF